MAEDVAARARGGISESSYRRLGEAMYAESRGHAREAITRFASEFGAKYPKAVTTLEKDGESAEAARQPSTKFIAPRKSIFPTSTPLCRRIAYAVVR